MNFRATGTVVALACGAAGEEEANLAEARAALRWDHLNGAEDLAHRVWPTGRSR